MREQSVRQIPGRRLACSTIVLFLSALALPAQTLDQAEQLWKARRFKEANDVFKALEAKDPKNADYKVRWGRMMLEHAQPSDAEDLFGEALEIKKDHAGALMGMALLAADSFEARAGDLARKALASDPKLTEAQELLARLALEDNDNPKATEEVPIRSRARRFWPPSTCWRIRRTRPTIRTPPRATRPSRVSSC